MQDGQTKINFPQNASGPILCAIVHRIHNGQVSHEWLSNCKEERALTTKLMEEVVSNHNLLTSLKNVVSNAGSAGVDGMKTTELGQWLQENLATLQSQLLEGTYIPQPVKKVNIPKADGGERQLGIPTVKDRLVHQAIHQVLAQRYEPIFSENSFGFRPGRSAHHALERACDYVKEGKYWVVDLDLEKFFDKVNHSRLLWLLQTRIGDKRLLRLISKILKSGAMEEGLTTQRITGTPQGSPLSPLLSNIVLDELDKELERRNLSYVRYADDVKIFVRTEKSANRVLESITRFIEERLKLKVNGKKSKVCVSEKMNFLGHGISRDGTLLLSKKSAHRLKMKIRTITSRKRGISFEQLLTELRIMLTGWLMYFQKARMTNQLLVIESWLKRKVRCFRLKQCKRTYGIVKLFRRLGVGEQLSWKTALSGKGWWRLSCSPASHYSMNNKWLHQQGYYDLLLNYKKFHRF